MFEPRAQRYTAAAPEAMNPQMRTGMRFKSATAEAVPLPTTSAPRRIAYRLNKVDTAVKQTEAIKLLTIFGVLLRRCTANSRECDVIGSSSITTNPAAQAGSARRNACVTAP